MRSIGIVMLMALSLIGAYAGFPIGQLPQGFFADDQKNESTADNLNAREANHDKNGWKAHLRIMQISGEGALCDVTFLTSKYSAVYSETAPHEHSSSVQSSTDEVKMEEPVWVTDLSNSESLVDGDEFDSTIWLSGTYSYTAVSGASKRVRKFTADPKKGAEIYEKLVMDRMSSSNP